MLGLESGVQGEVKHTAPMQSSGEGVGGYALPPFHSLSLCLAASHSLRQVTVQRKALTQALNCHGEHGRGCSASTQNWSLKQNGIMALFFVNEDD